MKLFRFFSIIAVMMLTFTACDETDNPVIPDLSSQNEDSSPVDGDDDGLVIAVDDDGISRTRTSYSGYSTTFTAGDEIGIYAYNGTTAVASNIKYTRQSNGTWSPATKVPYVSTYTYFAYYPYNASHGYTPGTSGNVDTRFATFIADASNKFWKADQSTKANYDASNLMMAQGTHVRSGNKVNFAMDHKRGLAVFTGDAADATFTGNIPYLMSGKKYFHMKPSTTTSFTDDEGTYSLSAASGKYVSHSISLNYVDFGLPSGTKWAKGNIVSDGKGGYKIGAETDFGAYFSWGNVTPHFPSSQSWGSKFDGNYDWGSSNTGSPYAGSAGASISYTSQHKGRDYTANTTNDAARACLGGSWQVPTATQFQELYDNTDNEWTTISGVDGCKFMKKTDHSVYVFFPAAGYGYMDTLQGTLGRYWSSSLYSDDRAYYLQISSTQARPQVNYNRYTGIPVRAVK